MSRCGPSRRGSPGRCRVATRRRAALLLEVVLALAVYVGMALAVLAGLASAVRSAEAVRLAARAEDLAVTLLSEVELGLVAMEDAGPEPFEDEALADWTWEVAVEPLPTELADLEVSRVEVVVRHGPSGYAYRLARLEVAPPAEAGGLGSGGGAGLEEGLP